MKASIVLAGTLLLAAGCNASVPVASAPDASDQEKVAAWRQCLNRSVAAQVARNSDRSMAVELAFISCRTEEDAFRAMGYRLVGSARTEQTMTDLKAALKRQFVQAR